MDKTARIDAIIDLLRTGYLTAKATNNDMMVATYVTGLKLFHAERLGSDDAGHRAAADDIAKLSAQVPAN